MKTLYILQSWGGGNCGVYSSQKKLAEAVDYYSVDLNQI